MINLEELRLFPFPTSICGNRMDGSIYRWPSVCRRCRDKPCESARIEEAIQTCPYGMDFVRHTSDLLIGGFVVRDMTVMTPAHTKRLRDERESVVSAETVGRALGALRAHATVTDREAAEARTRAKEAYLSKEESLQEVAAELRPVIEQNLSQAHDFLLLLQQIQANAATILEERFPGVPPAEAADRLPNEGAIYFAAELMLAKIDASAYLREPNRINARTGRFSIYRVIDKYARIYRSYARQREVDIKLEGESRVLVAYPAHAVGAVLHTLMDNMVKYAPPKSIATVSFRESRSGVTVTYSSLGPEIRENERERIFLVGYQGEAAKLVAGQGMGFGLAAAKLISDTLQLGLRVKQESKSDARFPGYYRTDFSIQFDGSGQEAGGGGRRPR